MLWITAASFSVVVQFKLKPNSSIVLPSFSLPLHPAHCELVSWWKGTEAHCTKETTRKRKVVLEICPHGSQEGIHTEATRTLLRTDHTYHSHITVYLPLQVALTLFASSDDPTAMDISHCPFNCGLCFEAKDTAVIYVFLRQAESSAEQQLWPYLLKYCIILPLPLERRFKNVLCQKPLCNQHCWPCVIN